MRCLRLLAAKISRSHPGAGCGYNTGMIRIRDILDPELRSQIIEKLAEQRGTSVAAIPDWFELDDADYVDLLVDIREEDQYQREYDPRM
jgi:hypothetical protein